MAKPKKRSKAIWTKRDWTPVRRGNAYCSPACGGGPVICSIQRYRHAVKVANEVARDLGPGWKPVVSENLGWHARVVSPCGRVHITVPTLSRDTGYMAFLGLERDHCGGRWAEHGTTPRSAMTHVLATARRDLRYVEDVLGGLSVPMRRGR